MSSPYDRQRRERDAENPIRRVQHPQGGRQVTPNYRSDPLRPLYPQLPEPEQWRERRHPRLSPAIQRVPVRGSDREARPEPTIRPGAVARHRRHAAFADSVPPEAQSRLPSLAAAAFALIANIIALGNLRFPFLGPAIGFWFLVLHPAYLLYTCSVLKGSRGAERVGYSVTAVLLVLMTAGLAINTVLPVIGVSRPLATVPIVIVADALNLTLYMLRRRWPATISWRSRAAALGPTQIRLLGMGGLSVTLAVLGANRLNNNAGGAVSLAALLVVLVTVILTLRRHRSLSDSLISALIYLISLALLLMTSLRGWYVTGHDIQSEYRVFQLTDVHGRWNISDFHNAYNACLSLTILPTEVARLVNVDNPYVYKVFFQLLFALCPVLAYTIARRYAPKMISCLAVVYFIGFPTFINDMPFLNRQEIAFLFVCSGLLAITNSQWPQAKRRVVLYASGLGVELSHYATMYVFLGLLIAGWLCGCVMRRFGHWLDSRRKRRENQFADYEDQPRLATRSRVVGLGSVLVLSIMLFLWGGLATHTAGPALNTVTAAISQFGHPNTATPYSILSRTTLSPQQVLNDYRSTALAQNSIKPSVYLQNSTHYSTSLAAQPDLPLTPLGHLLSNLGLPIETINTDVRQGAAKDEQLFLGVGFAAFLVAGRLRRRVSHEMLYIAAGSIFMVGIFTAFPDLSADYGPLRAFQEALILAAPVLVVGSLAIFSPFGQRWSFKISAAVCVVIFASTSGFLPQILGGYPPQLNLNDSGQYYDDYYSHPTDVAAASWLAHQPSLVHDGVQTPFGNSTANIFASLSSSDSNVSASLSNLYPVLIRRDSWVILSYGVVHTGRAPLSAYGQLIAYHFPMQLLESGKDRVYDNGSDEIYK
jgi:uncharacterized membrane protein